MHQSACRLAKLAAPLTSLASCTFFLSDTRAPYLDTAYSVSRGENAHYAKVQNVWKKRYRFYETKIFLET